uniref:Uncharacterized protein n=1 Tax=Mycena chlorophos TaxID=658473 RepID=A0ABQ0KY19_MYCCL|nr:predicted protein [Mycena chlorophos]
MLRLVLRSDAPRYYDDPATGRKVSPKAIEHQLDWSWLLALVRCRRPRGLESVHVHVDFDRSRYENLSLGKAPNGSDAEVPPYAEEFREVMDQGLDFLVAAGQEKTLRWPPDASVPAEDEEDEDLTIF